jgi:hypothetical protein
MRLEGSRVSSTPGNPLLLISFSTCQVGAGKASPMVEIVKRIIRIKPMAYLRLALRVGLGVS